MVFMPKDKTQLTEVVKESLNGANGLVLADFKGLTVSEMETLRKKVRKEGGSAKVVKNTLLEKAFESAQIKGMEPYLKDNTIMFYSKNDILAILKSIADYSKDHSKFVLKGGYIDGMAVDKDTVVALSKLPTKKEILSMIVGNISAVVGNLVGTLNSVMTTFVGTLEALEKKKQG
jgi:large subunit ribosomal protein L10